MIVFKEILFKMGFDAKSGTYRQDKTQYQVFDLEEQISFAQFYEYRKTKSTLL